MEHFYDIAHTAEYLFVENCNVCTFLLNMLRKNTENWISACLQFIHYHGSQFLNYSSCFAFGFRLLLILTFFTKYFFTVRYIGFEHRTTTRSTVVQHMSNTYSHIRRYVSTNELSHSLWATTSPLSHHIPSEPPHPLRATTSSLSHHIPSEPPHPLWATKSPLWHYCTSSLSHNISLLIRRIQKYKQIYFFCTYSKIQ